MKYLVHLNPLGIESFIDRLRNCHPSYFSEIEDRPHITLMTGRFKESDESQIVLKLEDITFNPLNFNFASYDIFNRGEKRVLVARFSRDDDSLRLHKGVCEALKQYINWEETPRFVNFGLPREFEQRRRTHDKYGFSAFGDFWVPHVTLGVLNRDTGREVFGKIPGLGGFNFEASSFYLSKRNPDSWEMLREFGVKS